MPTSQIKNIASEKFSIGAEALLIRDYWKEKILERKYIFDFLEEENDPWITSKKLPFEELLKKEILKEGPEQEFSNEKVGILNNVKIDEYYRNILYMIGPGEFKIEIQDEWTRQLLAKLIENYSEENVINFFDAFENVDEMEKYIKYCNPILSLLRNEYAEYINIEKLYKFIYTTDRKGDGNLKFKTGRRLILQSPVIKDGRRIEFNQKNGNIVLDGKLIGVISLNTIPRFFFECLYQNYGEAIPYRDIVKYLENSKKDNGKKVTGDSRMKHEFQYPTLCADWAQSLKEPIRNLIKGYEGYYILQDPQ